MKSLVVLVLLLGGCASIDVQSLDASLRSTGKTPGLIYYLPSPYLLVMELPPTQSTTAKTTQPAGGVQGLVKERSVAPVHNPPGRRDQVKPTPPGDLQAAPGEAAVAADAKADPKPAASTADGAASPALSTSTSFQAATPQYIAKLIYLQDRSRPMAISTKTGLFGNTALKPVFQDGWMLTSLDASAETKGSEAITAAAGLLTAVEGGGAAKAAGAAATGSKASGPGGNPSKPKSPDSLEMLFTQGSHILRPGLYAFSYGEDGKLAELKEVSVFTGCGVRSSDDALLKQMIVNAGKDC